ncbi:MAG: type VI secretion system tip protein VgrG [Gemmatimonadales bacterium]|nr:type VI secretion system tip protein VgrG [Gemmatimonadales bacterium]
MKVTVFVTIGDLVLRNSELDLLEVVQELGQHTTCRIEFIRDSAMDVSLEQLLRDEVVVTLKGESGQIIPIFRGAIGDGVQSHLLNYGSRFRLEATSASERLEYVNTAYFPQSTFGDIASEFGVRIEGSVRRDQAPLDLVQWNETEFAFLKRLADEHGAFLVTQGEEPELRTEFKDQGWELVWGDSLLEASVRARPTSHGVSGASYDPLTKHTHRHAGVRQNPPSLGGAAKVVNAVTDLARQMGGDPGLEFPTARETTHQSFKTILRQESERALGSAVLVEGHSVKVGLGAGDLVELIGGVNFTLPTTGKLGLIKVVHTFQDQHYSNRFVATPWKTFTNLERPPTPRARTVVTAEVVETATDPEKLGRVRVAYRWQTGDSMTGWARLAVPHAGNGRGIMFLPEVGDEVLVAFDDGDPEYPIVVGSLWNGRDLPPEATEQNTAKRIITRSGNTIQFLDDDGKETIEIFTPEGRCLVQLTNQGSHPVVTVYSEGDIALEAKEEIRLKCKKLVHDVGTDVVIKAGGDVSVEAAANAIIKANVDAALSGTNAILKGAAMVESVAGGINSVVGSMVHIQPPGFMGKQVNPKSAQVPKVDVGSRPTPQVADPERTADPETPR